jgi:hypothetical protein
MVSLLASAVLHRQMESASAGLSPRSERRRLCGDHLSSLWLVLVARRVSLDSPPPMVEYSFVPWNLPIGAWLTWYLLSETSKIELAGGPSNSHLDEIDRVLCPDRVHAGDI